MEITDEYISGWETMAKQYGCSMIYKHPYRHYDFPGTWENGWIVEVNAADGLFVSSAWFTTQKMIDYTINTKKEFILVFCIDSGNISVSQKGKSTQKLAPFTQIIVSAGNPLRLEIPANEHVCFTCVMIFNSCITKFLTANNLTYPIQVKDAKKWNIQNIDTSLVMLVMEQIRWGVRGNRIPAIAYLCKTIELLSIFAHNHEQQKYKSNRRHYVTWENEQKLYKVKQHIDLNCLAKPSIETLCLISEMSESKLRISFKSFYKQTIYAYIKESIMKRAMQMLGNDELSIKNIATICGYENPSKFTSAFKNIHGITPSDFRKGFGL